MFFLYSLPLIAVLAILAFGSLQPLATLLRLRVYAIIASAALVAWAISTGYASAQNAASTAAALSGLSGASTNSIASYSADFTPLFNLLITIACSIIAVAAPFYLKKLADLLEAKHILTIDAAQRKVLEDGMAVALQFGIAKAKSELPGKMAIEVKNPAIANAITYLSQRFPDAIAHFGLDSDKLAQALAARFGWQAAFNDNPVAAAGGAAAVVTNTGSDATNTVTVEVAKAA